ncbi:MAG: hypothetical protein MJ025_06850 [Victivallaceae bacterium]|nr:hypothetical protein [Victivallaceae bacterium]
MKKSIVFLLGFAIVSLFAAEQPALTVRFDQENGRIRKSLHGSNYMPSIIGANRDKDFQALRFTYCRTHDQALCNPGQRIVDTHFIFPREDADAADPKNYYFAATDHLLNTLVRNGGAAYYRLGTSIENTAGTAHFNTLPVRDAEQYAKIFAGIIRHYNHSWNNGFEMKIPYWEIWGEPNNIPCLWAGTKEEFIQFFATVLEHLKAEFPDEKIGGPGLTWPDPEWINPLLAECKKRGVTPDFISFHTYVDKPEVMVQLVGDCRAILDAAGCQETEVHLNEWHYLRGKWAELTAETDDSAYDDLTRGVSGMWGIDSAAFNVAMVALFHDVPLDVACYYGFGMSGNAGTWGFYRHGRRKNKTFHSMKMIGEFVNTYERRVRCESALPGIYALAAFNADRSRGAILLSDYRSKLNRVKLRLAGLQEIRNLEIVRLDQNNDENKDTAEIKDGLLTLGKDNGDSAVWLIRFDVVP